MYNFSDKYSPLNLTLSHTSFGNICDTGGSR